MIMGLGVGLEMGLVIGLGIRAWNGAWDGAGDWYWHEDGVGDGQQMFALTIILLNVSYLFHLHHHAIFLCTLETGIGMGMGLMMGKNSS